MVASDKRAIKEARRLETNFSYTNSAAASSSRSSAPRAESRPAPTPERPVEAFTGTSTSILSQPRVVPGLASRQARANFGGHLSTAAADESVTGSAVPAAGPDAACVIVHTIYASA